MSTERVIYTDGRDVTVTDSTLKVKHTAYKLSGITNFSMWTIRPDRWPAVLLLLLGIGAAVCGYLGLIPDSINLQTESGVIGGDALAIWVGIFLAVLGLLIMALMKERYAVRIGTAEGQKNAVVSKKREYIANIVDAIHHAFDMGQAGPDFVTNRD